MAGMRPLSRGGPDDLEDDALWEAYRKAKLTSSGEESARVREALTLRYLSLVRYIVGRISMSLPNVVEEEDLMSYGVLGLLDAVEKFDATRGVKFETYASTRIRGAIIDGLRKVDWVPRSVRSKARKLWDAYASLEGTGGEAPDEKLAEALGISREEVEAYLEEVSRGLLVSLDELVVLDDQGGTAYLLELIPDSDSPDPVAQFETKELKEMLACAIDALPERERLVITLRYYEELSVKEIARILGISQSRVSQLHTRAIMRIHARLTAKTLP